MTAAAGSGHPTSSMSAADIMAVTVNAVAPGPTATLLFLDGKRRETINEPASLPPLRRLGTPADIARWCRSAPARLAG
jgi:NAD(P)-dependent dehydrogenase (short-subunit alcohol dehydrogenase family)